MTAPQNAAPVIEAGSWDSALSGEAVAVIAHFSASDVASRSLQALVASLRATGIGTVLVSTSEFPSPLQFSSPAGSPDLVVRRPNIGYDFGSWAWAIGAQPALGQRRTLLLNDSMAGPFAPMDDVLRRFLHSQTDVWGLIGSAQFAWHLQSYCVGFAPGVLADPVVRAFWNGIRPQPTKQDVIMTYELGQSQLLISEGFTIDVLVPPGLLIDRQSNPAILAWRQLLDLGIPMVKKELIRDPSVAPDAVEIPDELRQRFGVDVQEWL